MWRLKCILDTYGVLLMFNLESKSHKKKCHIKTGNYWNFLMHVIHQCLSYVPKASNECGIQISFAEISSNRFCCYRNNSSWFIGWWISLWYTTSAIRNACKLFIFKFYANLLASCIIKVLWYQTIKFINKKKLFKFSLPITFFLFV